LHNHFKWGHAFFSLNAFRLEYYLSDNNNKNSDSLKDAETRCLAKMEEEVNENRNRETMMPPSDSSDEDEQAYLQYIRDKGKHEDNEEAPELEPIENNAEEEK